VTLYASLSEAIAETSSGVVSTTLDSDRLLRNLRTVSRRIDRMFGSKRPVFAPYLETRKRTVRGDNVNTFDNTFTFPWSLLSLSSVTLGTTALTIGTQVEAYSEDGLTPYTQLRLLDWGLSWYQNGGCSDPTNTPLRVAITGYWGVHRDYANAFLSVDALAAGINAAVTSFTVADVDGDDPYGFSPRISAGQLVQIPNETGGESELMEVTATNTASNVVSNLRSANGTTAATHANAAAVKVFQVEEPIRRVTARQAGLLYARRGAWTTVEVQGMGTEIRYPTDLLQELRATLGDYAYEY